MSPKANHQAGTQSDERGYAVEALAISIGERGKVDLPLWHSCLEHRRIRCDSGRASRVIFKDPMAPDAVEVGWQTASKYLSGDVEASCIVAQMAADRDSSFRINVEALQKAQPKDLDASEIDAFGCNMD